MKETLVGILILFILLLEMASSDSWHGYVKTTGDSWDIFRQNMNLSFESNQYIEGKTEAFKGPRGRILYPYSSYFEDIGLNDVTTKERTAALEGNYSSYATVDVTSEVQPLIGLDIVKQGVSDIYKIDFMEVWPVKMSAYRSLEYSGKGINYRDFSGNNLDYVGTNLLYNKNLSEDSSIEMNLERMNATVLATDNGIIRAERKATRDLNFMFSARTAGIANFKYQQSGTEFDRFSNTNYEILNKGDERYIGLFNLTKNIYMKSRFDDSIPDYDWLPRCYESVSESNLSDDRTQSVGGIFNRTGSDLKVVGQ